MGGNTVVPLMIIVIGVMNWGFLFCGFANRSYRRRKKH